MGIPSTWPQPALFHGDDRPHTLYSTKHAPPTPHLGHLTSTLRPNNSAGRSMRSPKAVGHHPTRSPSECRETRFSKVSSPNRPPILTRPCATRRKRSPNGHSNATRSSPLDLRSGEVGAVPLCRSPHFGSPPGAVGNGRRSGRRAACESCCGRIASPTGARLRSMSTTEPSRAAAVIAWRQSQSRSRLESP